jgi:hypothetical protein
MLQQNLKRPPLSQPGNSAVFLCHFGFTTIRLYLIRPFAMARFQTFGLRRVQTQFIKYVIGGHVHFSLYCPVGSSKCHQIKTRRSLIPGKNIFQILE